MTDLEITKACAEAMGIPFLGEAKNGTCIWTIADGPDEYIYDPLNKDAQAMALVKKFYLDINFLMPFEQGDPWAWRIRGTVSGWEMTTGQDLNRAICECVAKMWESKGAANG